MRGTVAALLAITAAIDCRAVAGPTAPDAAAFPSPAVDLAALTLRELEIERALPLARHGYLFRIRWLDQYFRAQPWYRPTGFDPQALTAQERARIDTVARFRAALSKADLDRRQQALWKTRGVPVSRDTVADEIEQALLARGLGRFPDTRLLDELAFEKYPELLVQPLDPDGLLAYAKHRRDLRGLEALIYARHGRSFASPRWRWYALSLDWYRADPQYSDSNLTALDRSNLALLASIERKLEPRAPRGRPDVAARAPRSAFPGCPRGTQRRESTNEESGTETIRCAKPVAGGEVWHGPYWMWRPTGMLGQTRAFVDGREDGPSVTWYWTGVRKEEGTFAGGKKQGTWRQYHPGGTLADEARFDAGKLHGPRRRFFPDGKPSLEASYKHGTPVGKWNAYYDNGRHALVATFPGTSVEGWRIDGQPWPPSSKITPCRDLKCTSVLDHLEIDSLPPVFPKRSCPGAGQVPRAAWTPILTAVRRYWGDEEESYLPGCVQKVTLVCGPDLDGVPGDEMLTQIDYRILINGESNCKTKDLNNVWQMSVLLAFSPPRLERDDWSARGFVGYPRFEADNGGTETSLVGFVRLPNGEAALHTAERRDSSDCGISDGENILVLRAGKWEGVAGRLLHACDRPDEAEEWDVF